VLLTGLKSAGLESNLAAAKGRKGAPARGKKGGKDSAADAGEEPAEGADAAPAPATLPAADGIAAAAAPETVVAGAPFAQGRDKAKAWFEARPAALDAVAALVREALKGGAAAGVVVGAADAPPGALAAVGAVDARLPGPAIDEEAALFGEEK
jgi:NADH-quinone oxidoreductase subunit C